MYKYGERLQIFRIERGRHREEYDLSMSYKFSKYILAFSCTWISKLRSPKGFSLHAFHSFLDGNPFSNAGLQGAISLQNILKIPVAFITISGFKLFAFI